METVELVETNRFRQFRRFRVLDLAILSGYYDICYIHVNIHERINVDILLHKVLIAI